MDKKRKRRESVLSGSLETLEGRVVLPRSARHPGPGDREVAAQAVHRAALTTTTLAVKAGTLGQPITFTATVRGPASAGSPSGTVNFTDHGRVFATATLSPASPNTNKSATARPRSP